MTRTGAPPFPALVRSGAVRAIGLFLVWVILSGGTPVDLLPGIAATLAATGISLALLPAGRGRVRPLALIKFAIRFLWQSVIAGVDVACRALDPRLPLAPGFVRYQTGLPRGPARNVFTTVMSLLPGTVPIETDESDRLIIHCLDVRQPVAAQLAVEEALLMRMTGQGSGNG